MNIRVSTEQDKHDIFHLHQNAFGEEEGEAIAQLSLELLEDKTALPLLSLVAEKDRHIIGHVIFSPVSVEGADGHQGYILAPLAVLGNYQGHGIDMALELTQGALTNIRGKVQCATSLSAEKYW